MIVWNVYTSDADWYRRWLKELADDFMREQQNWPGQWGRLFDRTPLWFWAR